MSIEHVKKQLKHFIDSPEPEVLALKGEWGVGKTHIWNSILNKVKHSGQIGMPKYAYVSLFGIESLQELRFSIFAQSINRDAVGTTPSNKTLEENTKSLFSGFREKAKNWREWTNYFKLIPQISALGGSFESLPFFSVTDTLICLDDLERRSDSIALSDILGLTTILKEQKNCKVIILLNEGKLEDKHYEKYREKVVDLELVFEPTAKECAEIAFEHCESTREKLSLHTLQLDIKNIRVLKKIERLYQMVSGQMQQYHPNIQAQIISSLVLFAWSHYRASEECIPTLEYIENLGYVLQGLGNDQNISDKEKQWNAILQEYGYLHTDELDKALIAFVKRGYLICDEIDDPASLLQTQIRAQEATGSFSDAWKVYHDSFNTTQDEVICALYDSFKANVDHISPLNLNGTVTIFRELDEDKLADEIIDLYISHHVESPEHMNLKNYPFGRTAIDENLKLKFEAISLDLHRRQSPIEVLDRVSRNGSWSPEDEDSLARITSDEFYKIFKEKAGSELSDIINTCLKFGRFENSNEKQQTIADNATEALMRIARESTVNELRVRKFGVFLNEAKDLESCNTSDKTGKL